MTLQEFLQRVERTGSRLDNLESAVGAIRKRLRFWQIAAVIGIGSAVVLFLAWRGAHQRLEDCQRRNKLAA